MARFAGYQSASITFASSPGLVLLVNSHNVRHVAGEIDVSAYSDGQDDVFIPGTRNATIDIEGTLDGTSAIPAPGAAAAALTVTHTAGMTRTVSGFWTSIEEGVTRNGKGTVRGTFRVTGTVTRVP